MRSRFLLELDPDDPDDLTTGIVVLQGRLALLRPVPAVPSSDHDAMLRNAVAALFEGTGQTRRGALDLLAAAGASGVDLGELVAVLPRPRSLNGLRTSLKRAWNRTGLALSGPLMERRGHRYYLNLEVARIIVELHDLSA
jgi:hypothetical protein